MAAVNLLKLRKEINSLLWKFTDPEGFKADLIQILSQYETLPFRSSQAVHITGLSQCSQVPLLVYRELELAFYPVVLAQPEAALALADTLWVESDEAVRRIASILLGQIPLTYADQILARLLEWAQTGLDPEEVSVLFENAASQLRSVDVEVLLQAAADWSRSPIKSTRLIGLRSLIFLLEDPGFINLPTVFNVLEDLFSDLALDEVPEVTRIIELSLDKSNIETSYFMRQQLEKNPSRELTRICRRLLPQFSAQSQDQIQHILRNSYKRVK
jgi:hypothetical protein